MPDIAPAIEAVDPEAFVASAASGPAALVQQIVAACDAADGVETLNEQARLQLAHHGLQSARLWLCAEIGFALLRGEDLDIAVHPHARGHGAGTALARIALTGLAQVDAWSHADDPAAAQIAARFGVPRARELKIMSRATSIPVPEPAAPAGITIRGFRPDDEAALLEINAAAFAHHPEQGQMSAADFRERTAQTWFDPAGLLVAVDAADRLLGFHWTKVHGEESPPYGEVYVVAVSPDHAGRGLGTLLTEAGLDHLAGTGVDTVILYVEGDNAPAIAVYRGRGFSDLRTEVQYRGVPHLSR